MSDTLRAVKTTLSPVMLSGSAASLVGKKVVW